MSVLRDVEAGGKVEPANYRPSLLMVTQAFLPSLTISKAPNGLMD